jgi:hypothetical protein
VPSLNLVPPIPASIHEVEGFPMLPPFIIEQIRQREEEKNRARREDNRPRLELPLERYPSSPRRAPEEEDDPNRGVIILDLG